MSRDETPARAPLDAAHQLVVASSSPTLPQRSIVARLRYGVTSATTFSFLGNQLGQAIAIWYTYTFFGATGYLALDMITANLAFTAATPAALVSGPLVAAVAATFGFSAGVFYPEIYRLLHRGGQEVPLLTDQRTAATAGSPANSSEQSQDDTGIYIEGEACFVPTAGNDRAPLEFAMIADTQPAAAMTPDTQPTAWSRATNWLSSWRRQQSQSIQPTVEELADDDPTPVGQVVGDGASTSTSPSPSPTTP